MAIKSVLCVLGLYTEGICSTSYSYLFRHVSSSTNFRGSTKSKGHRREVRNYRGVCTLEMRAAKLPPLSTKATPTTVIYDLEFFYGPSGDRFDNYYRARDYGNAIGSVKGLLDALQDAGVIPNDSKKYLKAGNVEMHTTNAEHGGKCGVILRLRTED